MDDCVKKLLIHWKMGQLDVVDSFAVSCSSCQQKPLKTNFTCDLRAAEEYKMADRKWNWYSIPHPEGPNNDDIGGRRYVSDQRNSGLANDGECSQQNGSAPEVTTCEDKNNVTGVIPARSVDIILDSIKSHTRLECKGYSGIKNEYPLTTSCSPHKLTSDQNSQKTPFTETKCNIGQFSQKTICLETTRRVGSNINSTTSSPKIIITGGILDRVIHSVDSKREMTCSRPIHQKRPAEMTNATTLQGESINIPDGTASNTTDTVSQKLSTSIVYPDGNCACPDSTSERLTARVGDADSGAGTFVSGGPHALRLMCADSGDALAKGSFPVKPGYMAMNSETADGIIFKRDNHTKAEFEHVHTNSEEACSSSSIKGDNHTKAEFEHVHTNSEESRASSSIKGNNPTRLNTDDGTNETKDVEIISNVTVSGRHNINILEGSCSVNTTVSHDILGNICATKPIEVVNDCTIKPEVTYNISETQPIATAQFQATGYSASRGTNGHASEYHTMHATKPQLMNINIATSNHDADQYPLVVRMAAPMKTHTMDFNAPKQKRTNTVFPPKVHIINSPRDPMMNVVSQNQLLVMNDSPPWMANVPQFRKVHTHTRIPPTTNAPQLWIGSAQQTQLMTNNALYSNLIGCASNNHPRIESVLHANRSNKSPTQKLAKLSKLSPKNLANLLLIYRDSTKRISSGKTTGVWTQGAWKSGQYPHVAPKGAWKSCQYTQVTPNGVCTCKSGQHPCDTPKRAWTPCKYQHVTQKEALQSGQYPHNSPKVARTSGQYQNVTPTNGVGASVRTAIIPRKEPPSRKNEGHPQRGMGDTLRICNQLGTNDARHGAHDGEYDDGTHEVLYGISIGKKQTLTKSQVDIKYLPGSKSAELPSDFLIENETREAVICKDDRKVDSMSIDTADVRRRVTVIYSEKTGDVSLNDDDKHADIANGRATDDHTIKSAKHLNDVSSGHNHHDTGGAGIMDTSEPAPRYVVGCGPSQCVICKKILPSVTVMEMHMNSHINASVFVCGVCGTTFPGGGSLRRHMTKQHGLKEFECDVCLRMFTEKGNLTRHMNTHTGKRPHQCAICRKEFSQKQSLRDHMRTHADDRVFACHLCDKRFSLRQTLTYHYKRHYNLKPHVCSVCKASFVKQHELVRHLGRSRPNGTRCMPKQSLK